MGQHITDTLNKTSLKEKENCGFIKEPTWVTSKMGRWMAKVFSDSPMGQFMMDSTKIIGSTELANTIKMAKYLRANGKMG